MTTVRLKADPVTRRVPIVVITTRIEAQVRNQAVAAGCDRFLMLPCDPGDLMNQLRQILLVARDVPRPNA